MNPTKSLLSADENEVFERVGTLQSAQLDEESKQ